MCRLIAIVASEPTEFGLVLKEAPRSLAKLSEHHPDGWGIAIHSTTDAADGEGPWRVHHGTERADADRRFHEIAARSRGHVLIAHVRQKTVGPTRLENTHPFTRDGWTFAHNGTISDTATLRARTSPRRLAQIAGDTDSELFFAFLLTRLDEHGLVRLETSAARDAANDVIEGATSELRDAKVGAINFLLSDGATCFAHRFGRTLFLLERRPSDPRRGQREVLPGTTLVTKWTSRRHALFVASERITDEPWEEVPEGTFLRVDRFPAPTLVQRRPARSA